MAESHDKNSLQIHPVFEAYVKRFGLDYHEIGGLRVLVVQPESGYSETFNLATIQGDIGPRFGKFIETIKDFDEEFRIPTKEFLRSYMREDKAEWKRRDDGMVEWTLSVKNYATGKSENVHLTTSGDFRISPDECFRASDAIFDVNLGHVSDPKKLTEHMRRYNAFKSETIRKDGKIVAISYSNIFYPDLNIEIPYIGNLTPLHTLWKRYEQAGTDDEKAEIYREMEKTYETLNEIAQVIHDANEKFEKLYQPVLQNFLDNLKALEKIGFKPTEISPRIKDVDFGETVHVTIPVNNEETIEVNAIKAIKEGYLYPHPEGVRRLKEAMKPKGPILPGLLHSELNSSTGPSILAGLK